jgi:hypothetical protein
LIEINRPAPARAYLVSTHLRGHRCHDTGTIVARFPPSNERKEFAMKALIGAAMIAGALALAGPVAIDPAVAAPQTKARTAASSDATDFSAHRRHYRRYHRYGYRPYYRPAYRPYYYARPHYYQPYPYYRPYPYYGPYPYVGVGPFGFGFGVGVGPYW